MRVNLGTVTVSDEDRRKVARHFGNPGLATREMVRNFIVDEGLAAIDAMTDARGES